MWGIEAGLLWGKSAEATVVYIDRGVSRGMEYGIEAAKAAGRTIEYRQIETGQRNSGRSNVVGLPELSVSEPSPKPHHKTR